MPKPMGAAPASHKLRSTTGTGSSKKPSYKLSADLTLTLKSATIPTKQAANKASSIRLLAFRTIGESTSSLISSSLLSLQRWNEDPAPLGKEVAPLLL